MGVWSGLGQHVRCLWFVALTHVLAALFREDGIVQKGGRSARPLAGKRSSGLSHVVRTDMNVELACWSIEALNPGLLFQSIRVKDNDFPVWL